MSEFATETENVMSDPPFSTLSSGMAVPDNEPSDITQVNPQTSGWSDPSIVTKPPCGPTTPEEPEHEEPDHLRNSPPPNFEAIEEPPTPTVSLTIVPPGSQGLQPLRLDKSLPASPNGTTAPNSARIEHKINAHRRNSSDSAINLPDSLSGPSTIARAQTSDHASSLVSFLDIPLSPLPCPFPHARPRPGKVLQLTGDDSAQAFHNAKQAQANLPWFLRHRHGDEEIKLEFDGTVKAGTLPALVEHLVVNPLRENRFSTPQL